MTKGNNGSNVSKFAIGALFGAAVGAVAGILTAPKSGKETRQDIKRKANQTKDVAIEKAKDAKKYVNDRTEEAKGYFKKSKTAADEPDEDDA